MCYIKPRSEAGHSRHQNIRISWLCGANHKAKLPHDKNLPAFALSPPICTSRPHKNREHQIISLPVHNFIPISCLSSPRPLGKKTAMSSTSSVSEFYELRVRQVLQESEQQLERMARCCEETIEECERFLAQEKTTQTTPITEPIEPRQANIPAHPEHPLQMARTSRKLSRAQGSRPPPISSHREIQPPIQPCEAPPYGRRPFGTSCIQWDRPWSDNGKPAFTGPRHWGGNELKTTIIQAPPSKEDHEGGQEPDPEGGYVLVRRRAESKQGPAFSGAKHNEAAAPAPDDEGEITKIRRGLETVELLDEVQGADDDMVAVYYAAE